MKRGDLTSEELVLMYFEQIDRQNPQLNAYVSLNREKALSAARQADRALRNGLPLGALHGIPISVKDNVMQSDLPTSSGHKPFSTFMPGSDATCVSKLKAAGAIILGKTNLPALTYDLQTNNSLHGRTNNPWNLGHTPGGSSGGCATAVASGMSRISFCNDSGGSIRIPAHFCGIYGFKPSFGAVETDGILTVKKRKPAELNMRSLISSGLLAQSVEDLRISFEILRKKHIEPAPSENRTQLKLLWIDELPELEVDSRIKIGIQHTIKSLDSAGVSLTRFEPTQFDFMGTIRMWGHLSNFETGAELPWFTRSIGSLIMRRKYNRIPMYTHLLKPLSKRSYQVLRRRQEELKVKFEQLLEGYDGLILPASSVLAIAHQRPNRKLGHLGIYTKPVKVNDKKMHYAVAIQSYSLPFNVLESPVVSLPIGLSEDHLPIGIQLVGRKNCDVELLDVAEKLSGMIGSIGRPPVFSS